MATQAVGAPWRRVKWTRAGQLAGLASAGEALAGLHDAPPPVALAALRESNPQVAVRFMAQCLPRFDAVRWLHEGLARSAAPPPGSARAEIRTGIAAWLADPSDKRRRLVFEFAEAAGFDAPEGAAGLAIFLSGGGLGPAELEHGAQAAVGAFGQAVAGAMLLTGMARGPEHFASEIDALLGLAVAIAEAE